MLPPETPVVLFVARRLSDYRIRSLPKTSVQISSGSAEFQVNVWMPVGHMCDRHFVRQPARKERRKEMAG